MAKPKPLNLGFQLEALAWRAYVGALEGLGLQRASRWGAAIVPAAMALLRNDVPPERHARHHNRRECGLRGGGKAWRRLANPEASGHQVRQIRDAMEHDAAPPRSWKQKPAAGDERLQQGCDVQLVW